MDNGAIMNFQIEEWDKISECFGNMFRGLGEVTTTADMLQFTSIEPPVATGSVLETSKIAANMPLQC